MLCLGLGELKSIFYKEGAKKSQLHEIWVERQKRGFDRTADD